MALLLFATACSRPSGPEQAEYRDRVIKARESLFEGKFTYSVLEDAAPGESQTFRVDVTGLPAEGSSTADPRPGHGQETVPVGATIGAVLHCTGAQVKCIPNSSERQSVLAAGESADWQWTVQTPRAGTVHATLTLTVYYRNEDLVLAEPEPVNLSLEVEEEHPFLAFLGDFWQWLVGILSALGGTGGVIAYLEWRNRRRATTPDGQDAKATSQPPSREDQPAEGREPRV